MDTPTPAPNYSRTAITEAPIRQTPTMVIANVNRGAGQTALEVKLHDDEWVVFNGIHFNSVKQLRDDFNTMLVRLQEARHLKCGRPMILWPEYDVGAEADYPITYEGDAKLVLEDGEVVDLNQTSGQAT